MPAPRSIQRRAAVSARSAAKAWISGWSSPAGARVRRPRQAGSSIQARLIGVIVAPGPMPLTRIPMARAGTAEEMGGVACFLASDDGAYITGQTLFVDGGLTLYPSFREPWSSE